MWSIALGQTNMYSQKTNRLEANRHKESVFLGSLLGLGPSSAFLHFGTSKTFGDVLELIPGSQKWGVKVPYSTEATSEWTCKILQANKQPTAYQIQHNPTKQAGDHPTKQKPNNHPTKQTKQPIKHTTNQPTKQTSQPKSVAISCSCGFAALLAAATAVGAAVDSAQEMSVVLWTQTSRFPLPPFFWGSCRAPFYFQFVAQEPKHIYVHDKLASR